MDGQQRGRSPSAGPHATNIRHSRSPSSHGVFHSNVSGLGNDPSLTNDQGAYDGSNSFDLSTQYLTAHAQQQQSSPQFSHDGNHYSTGSFDPNGTSPNHNSFDGQFFAENNGSNNHEQFINPSSLLDPQLLDPSPPPEGSVDPSNLMNHMASTQHAPTPPHMLQPGMPHGSSPNHSPSVSQASFTSPGHSRHTSLDPSSAAFPQAQNGEWGHVRNAAFQGHRRAASDAYSDVSSSAHPSPYLGHTESYDGTDQPSPLLSAQDPALFQDMLSFQQFSISDQGQPQQTTPGHSPHISPRLPPQQQELPPFTPANNFGLSQSMGDQYGAMQYTDEGQQVRPSLHQHHSSLDFGQADQMSPPEINIDFAPPSRQPSFGPRKGQSQSHNALSPPDRSRSRNRMRAVSDPFIHGSRPSTPGTEPADQSASLSPNAAKSQSRSSSPGGKTTSRRSSTSSIPHRDYILDLADPSRPANASDVSNPNSKRMQKHPATFQCTLCPKRFTRAYNLRSHLRTHTDERPFVCSVCGKAFARQHDRKRHEGLHSGEKKFVCRGVLKAGSSWGCGRRFARADALGRHFRSEAGRVCIRPLLEEEAQEKGWDATTSPPQHHLHHPHHGMDPSAAGMLTAGNPGLLGQPHPMHAGGGQQPMPHLTAGQPGFDPSFPGGMAPSTSAPPPAPYGLPAALLAQYPALAGIQWDALPPGPPPDELEGDVSGRSSFDASSGGEMFEDDEPDFGGGPGPATTAAGYGWDGGYEQG